MQPLLPSKEVGLMGIGDIKFFESGLALIEGEGDLRGALTQLIQLAAEGANSNSASFYVIDAQEKVLKPLVTYGLPAAYVEACGNVRVGEECGVGVSHSSGFLGACDKRGRRMRRGSGVPVLRMLYAKQGAD